MKVKIENIKISDVDNLNYEGYIWYSNEKKPELINGKFDIKKLTGLPFIIEGNLWAEKEKISISIKNIDGEYLITRFNLSGISKKEFTDGIQKQISHRLEGVGKIKLFNIWEQSEKDELLEGMITLKPAGFAFVGFINKKNGGN